MLCLIKSAEVNLGFAEHLYNLEASQAATFLKVPQNHGSA